MKKKNEKNRKKNYQKEIFCQSFKVFFGQKKKRKTIRNGCWDEKNIFFVEKEKLKQYDTKIMLYITQFIIL